jgi:hypothetical protein
MKQFKTKHFSKWANKSKIADVCLLKASEELEKGLFAANLGGNIFKIRISRESKGKSSGFRTILAYIKNVRVIFLYGFSKNERDNISKNELDAFKTLGKDYLALNPVQLEYAEKTGILIPLEETKCAAPLKKRFPNP